MNTLPSKMKQPNTQATPPAYWSLALEQLLSALHASRDGLQPADAEQRLKQYGPEHDQSQAAGNCACACC